MSSKISAGRGRLDGIEVKWKRKDGNVITVRISGRAVSSADEPADVLEAIAEDVTERRALEDQFRQAQKMEAVGRLAGGVAHDFNNLLMVISGYAEVILAKLPLDHPLHEKGRAIQQAADRATTLTRQLLAFSRKQLLELKVVDVNAIVQDMERLVRPLIGENVELITSLSPQAAPHSCRRRTTRASPHEPGRQRQRCHARRRQAHHPYSEHLHRR